MKTHSSHLISARTILSILFLLAGLTLLCTLPFVSTRAQLPSNVTTFSGTYDPHVYPCNTPRHHFNVGTGQTRLVVQVSAAVPTNDISVTLLYGPDPAPVFVQTEDTATSSEALIY